VLGIDNELFLLDWFFGRSVGSGFASVNSFGTVGRLLSLGFSNDFFQEGILDQLLLDALVQRHDRQLENLH
jgi:hypothetical protein